MPAFYCGIFGHKPTVGIVNTRGCTFRTGKELSTMVVAGPMTRKACDLLPIMKVCPVFDFVFKFSYRKSLLLHLDFSWTGKYKILKIKR